MQRIGVLGGTFDPIHHGHLIVAEEVRAALGLHLVYIVPVAAQPLKRQHIAAPWQRMAMVRLACANHESLIPSKVDIDRPPPSYTVDTLRLLRAHHTPNDTFWFILGSDAAASLPHWKNYHEVLRLARLALVSRAGNTVDLDTLESACPGIAARCDTLDVPHLEISSSDVRQRLATGRPVRYLLPDAVLTYIRQHRLYGVLTA